MKTGRFSVLLGFITTHCRENSNQENGIPFWVSCPQWPNDLPLGPMSQRFHHLPHCTVQTGTKFPTHKPSGSNHIQTVAWIFIVHSYPWYIAFYYMNIWQHAHSATDGYLGCQFFFFNSKISMHITLYISGCTCAGVSVGFSYLLLLAWKFSCQEFLNWNF
jgi:hypothetical protein